MSTVAGAVVTIDGDSSGLVSALQKGEKGIADVKQEAGKLSDQLREVADDADKAAGAMIQKLGGPGAIKAIAGVTAGFAIAKQGVEMFLDSAENLFKSYGEEGQKVWDETEKSLFAIKGAFAEAVLGGGDMEQMGARLKVIFETALDVINFLLIPVRALGELLWMLRGDTDDATAATDKLNQALIETGEAQAKAAAAVAKRTTDIKALYNQALVDIGLEELAQQDAALQSADAYQQGLQDVLGRAAQTAGKILADGSIYVQDERDRIEGIILDLESSPEAMREAYGALAKAGLEEEIKQIEVFRQAKAAALAKSRGEDDTGAPKGVGGAVRQTAEDIVYAVQLAGGGYAELTKQQYEAYEEAARVTGDYSSRIVEMRREEFKNIEDAAVRLGIVEADLGAKRAEAAEKEAELRRQSAAKAKEELDTFQAEELARTKAASDQRLEIDKKAAEVLFNLAITQNGKMLANAIVANKKMGDIARAALGNVASGLGDIAMIQATKYAAEGLYPQAAGMAVAGTLAYTVAGVLGADKKANAGPPTERQQPVQNYAYNLRIDSTFADSESISRRFAQMQEGARQRGLITAAA